MGKVIQIGPAEEFDENPGQVGKKKIVRVQTVSQESASQPRED